MENNNNKIKITKNGPYLISGDLELKKEIIDLDEEGHSIGWKDGEKYLKQESYSLCRCGQSKNKPFCDGSHIKINFDGTETAGHEKYINQTEKISGPEIELTDAPKLCALVRFCHNKKGNVWDLTEESNNPDSKGEAIQQACNCSAGRLVMWDKKTSKAIEPILQKSISFIEDPKTKTSGPICVKGGIKIESADSEEYEIRNRVTLCRCGKSKNKPFCDASHVSSGFNDGDKSIQF